MRLIRGDSMLAYSTVAHKTGVHIIRFQWFCSPSLTNLAPPSGQRLQSDRKLYVFRPCSSLSAAAAPSPNVSPQCTFLIYRLLGSSPLAPFAVNMISRFDSSLAGCSQSTQQECNAHARQAQVYTHLSSLPWMYGLPFHWRRVFFVCLFCFVIFLWQQLVANQSTGSETLAHCPTTTASLGVKRRPACLPVYSSKSHFAIRGRVELNSRSFAFLLPGERKHLHFTTIF